MHIRKLCWGNGIQKVWIPSALQVPTDFHKLFVTTPPSPFTLYDLVTSNLSLHCYCRMFPFNLKKYLLSTHTFMLVYVTISLAEKRLGHTEKQVEREWGCQRTSWGVHKFCKGAGVQRFDSLPKGHPVIESTQWLQSKLCRHGPTASEFYTWHRVNQQVN